MFERKIAVLRENMVEFDSHRLCKSKLHLTLCKGCFTILNMNLIFAGLVLILSIFFISKVISKTRKNTVTDERTELVKLKASRATFVVFVITLALSSFVLIYFGQNGRIPSNFVYYLGVITSYLTSLLLLLFLIFYAYFNNKS